MTCVSKLPWQTFVRIENFDFSFAFFFARRECFFLYELLISLLLPVASFFPVLSNKCCRKGANRHTITNRISWRNSWRCQPWMMCARIQAIVFGCRRVRGLFGGCSRDPLPAVGLANQSSNGFRDPGRGPEEWVSEKQFHSSLEEKN